MRLEDKIDICLPEVHKPQVKGFLFIKILHGKIELVEGNNKERKLAFIVMSNLVQYQSIKTSMSRLE